MPLLPKQPWSLRELERDVDEALYWIWDPIGIKDSKGPRGEYWAYVPHVFKLLRAEKPEEEVREDILQYLIDVEENSITVPGNKPATLDRLLEVRRAHLQWQD
ncbi:MAG TPA: hypothetical protein PLB31_05680 [Fimbriimonadaceae bacterium]|nr:hypothetical protein [Armatimonadota bacterium]HCM72671.1 hypothetical protein [Armatimonadota bacterium]HRD30699.1 hypothetical protein [Fimbriimonadaceae bacterium]HRE93168.1 hypothetical protein [Fimbriimonadaceae bacterium]HRI73946.1 hypothetical protein [Fimbriimonadaceae bacterium]